MKDILSLVVIFSVFGGIFILAAKSKQADTENSETQIISSKNSIFGSFTFFIAILLFIWSIVCFCGGPDGGGITTKGVIWGCFYLLSSIFIGYKSI